MKTLNRILVVIAALLAASAVHAQRSPVPIVDRPNVPVVTGSGKPISHEALNRAIMNGGGAGARKWDVVPAAGGKSLRATYKVRSHTVVVDIVPGSDSYSVKYAESINMKYGVDNGTPVIHPFYNTWVDELIESIRVELRKL
jgi:hypothetical protein